MSFYYNQKLVIIDFIVFCPSLVETETSSLANNFSNYCSLAPRARLDLTGTLSRQDPRGGEKLLVLGSGQPRA